MILPNLKSLTRSFKAEQKLLLKPPALVSNRELVDLFLECLKEAFQTQLEHSLNIQLSKDSKKKSIDDDKAHCPEDPYRLTESLMHQHVTMAPTIRQTTQPTWKMGPDSCWYCEELGHFATNCPHQDKHIRTGKLKFLVIKCSLCSQDNQYLEDQMESQLR